MEYFYLAFAFFVAGFIPEITGFGVSVILMSLLPMILPISLVIPLVAISSLIVTGIVSYTTKEKNLFKNLKPILIGSAFGIFFGMFFLNLISERILSNILGIFLIFYSLYVIFFKKIFLTVKNTNSVLVGLVAGFFGALFNIKGPIVGIYFAGGNFSKDKNKDLIATYMFFAGILIVSGHIFSNRITEEILYYFLFSLPFIFFGIFLGSKVFHRVNTKIIRLSIYFLVLFAGIRLLI